MLIIPSSSPIERESITANGQSCGDGLKQRQLDTTRRREYCLVQSEPRNLVPNSDAQRVVKSTCTLLPTGWSTSRLTVEALRMIGPQATTWSAPTVFLTTS